MRRTLAFLALVLVAVSCDPGWTYLVRRPGGELPVHDPIPAPANDRDLSPGPPARTWSLAGGRVRYSLTARWFSLGASVVSTVHNASSVPLRIRVDRARLVLGSGLVVAASAGDAPPGARSVVVAPGQSWRLFRQFGPLDPYRGCMRANPDLARARFEDDGLELDGAPVEASFELEARER